MRKLKLLMLGAALLAAGTFGVSYFLVSEAEAQGGPIAKCSWNGQDCFDPLEENMCICEEKEEDN
jgi:hypothetical protein